MKLRRSLIVLVGLGLLVVSKSMAVPAVAWAAPVLQEGQGGGGATFFGAVPLIVLFPVIGLLINMAFGQKMDETWVGLTASTAAGLSFLVAVLQAISLVNNGYQAQIVHLADWIVIGDLDIPWALQVDTLSVTMMLVVTGVGTLIHVYAIGYEHSDVRHNGDPGRFPRFFVYLNLFLAAMLILVTGNNYLVMFVGWEGVGLCSYLLIGFWFEKGENNVGNARAGRKAFVVNRVGDWAMLLAMFLIFWMFGSLTFDEVFGRAASIRLDGQGQLMVAAITLLLLIGAAGKSAQVPLYVWLPDAMAGPTPVSALIHAATMVTAGIYMITRSNALYALAPFSADAVAWVGAITAILAATIAVGQFDIKRVLAYSTISQLGFMVAAVGLGGYVAGMFHLVTHAFFKALLFLSSGSVIHAMEHGMAAPALPEAGGAHGGGHENEHGNDGDSAPGHAKRPSATSPPPHLDPQDMRNMGGLWSKLPVTRWVYLIGALALAGIFPLAGFWSKDEILLDASVHNQPIYWILTVTAGFTAFYMGRQILMVFFGQARTPEARHAGESPAIMLVPLVALAILSVFGGALNLPTVGSFDPAPSVLTPWGAHGLTEWLDHTLHPEAAAEGEAGHEVEGAPSAGALDFGVAGISTGLALLALAVSFVIYRRKPETAEERDPLQGLVGPIFTGMNRKWWVDEFYDLIILRPYNWLARVCADVIDWQFWHDWFHDKVIAGLFNTFSELLAQGVDLGFIDALANGLADLSKGIAGLFRRVQTGYVRSYALAVFMGVVVVLGYFLLAK
jgi:NADH-quinone oxidoreductase subunit L